MVKRGESVKISIINTTPLKGGFFILKSMATRNPESDRRTACFMAGNFLPGDLSKWDNISVVNPQDELNWGIDCMTRPHDSRGNPIDQATLPFYRTWGAALFTEALIISPKLLEVFLMEIQQTHCGPLEILFDIGCTLESCSESPELIRTTFCNLKTPMAKVGEWLQMHAFSQVDASIPQPTLDSLTSVLDSYARKLNLRPISEQDQELNP